MNSSRSFRWFPDAAAAARVRVYIYVRVYMPVLLWIIIVAIAMPTGTPQRLHAQSPGSLQTAQGKHIRLKSDGGTAESLQELIDAFDAAVPQWERFWQLNPGTLDGWRVEAFVMSDAERFRDSGDLPADLMFPFGYAIDSNLWVMRQQSDYYTRHLLLHEGVHSLAIELFRGTGPSWYAEGIAEMLAVHRGSGNQIEINAVPAGRNEVPYWGRFKLIAQRRMENRIPILDAVLGYPADLKGDVESYGWAWVAVMLFAEYPEYRAALIQAAQQGSVRSPAFSAAFKRQMIDQWPIIQARWRMLVHTIDYGFDWSRERIELSLRDSLWRGQSIDTTIHASQGWQSLGVRFAPGMRVKITASGQCSLQADPKPWISQPGGVTIHYANDRPLGQLLMCVLPNKTTEQDFVEPLSITAIENGSEFVAPAHCWLLFRINDSLPEMSDNEGGYTVTIGR